MAQAVKGVVTTVAHFCTAAMVEPTQLDSGVEILDEEPPRSMDPTHKDRCAQTVDEEPQSLPIAEANPSQKRMKLEIGHRDCTKDAIRWIPCEEGLVPFVKNGGTEIVHSGRCQMRVLQNEACQAVKHVQCLSGCPPECSGHLSGCQCLCHLLRAYDNERLKSL